MGSSRNPGNASGFYKNSSCPCNSRDKAYLCRKSTGVPTIRQNQVAELVRRHFSMLLLEQGRYIFGEGPLVTVTEVRMSPDLTLAKVYLSVYNTDNKQAVLLELEDQHPMLRQHMAHRVRHHIRRVPELAFYLDETLDEMERVDHLFKRLYAEDQMGQAAGEEE